MNPRPLKHPSPSAEGRQGDLRRVRLGLILVVVVFIVAGMLLYTRLAALPAANLVPQALNPPHDVNA